jgi:hypothetical protein
VVGKGMVPQKERKKKKKKKKKNRKKTQKAGLLNLVSSVPVEGVLQSRCSLVD